MTTTPTATRTGVRMLLAGDPEWDAARGTFNLVVDQRPEAIAVPADADEVAEAVSEARARGWRIAPQGAGHGAGSLGDLSGTLLLSTARLTGVEIDAPARRVRVGAATKWRDVAPRLSGLGLAALHGSSPDVGIAGYSLGGGIGWLSRKHGMQANAVTAITLVTAGGEHVRATADEHPDLFWALRGGWGNLGVVTEIEFGVVSVDELYSGALFFPAESTADVLSLWTSLLPSFPDELTTWLTVLHFPPTDDVPEPVRERSFVILMGAFLGPEREGRALLAPFRHLTPVMDTFATNPPAALAELAMDPTEPLPYRTTTALLDGLSPQAIEDIGRLAAPGSPLVMIQLRHGGGALHRAPVGAGARTTLPGEIVALALAVAPDETVEAAAREELAAFAQVVAPHVVGVYPNFVEEPGTDPSTFFDAETWARLRRVKAEYDPTDSVRGMHQIPPAR